MKIRIAIYMIAALLMGGALKAEALEVELTDVAVDHTATSLVVKMNVDASAVTLKSNEEILVEPAMEFADGRSVALTPVLFAGRNRRIQAERHPAALGDAMLSEAGAVVALERVIPYEEWMEQGQVVARVTKRGCCRREIEEQPIASTPWNFHVETWTFAPELVFITPDAESPKIRDLKGSAFIDFRVNRTEIDPVYRSNPRELGVIYATIDSVINDPDVKLKAISFTGYASPEGPWNNNVRLAKGRTAALCDYVRQLYDFPASALSTASVPEDWDGLRRAIENSSYPNRRELLAVINDSTLKPDDRDRRLATRFPNEYKEILRDIYPALRHCDYTINYEVVTYDDPVKILELLETAPQKLSLREMFVGAKTLEPGSERYCRVFETAARMFPTSDIANLNAAISEIQSGNIAQARYFIDRAGDLPISVYTRGAIAALEGDYAGARTLLQQALDMGVAEASDALEQLDRMPAEKK